MLFTLVIDAALVALLVAWISGGRAPRLWATFLVVLLQLIAIAAAQKVLPEGWWPVTLLVGAAALGCAAWWILALTVRECIRLSVWYYTIRIAFAILLDYMLMA